MSVITYQGSVTKSKSPRMTSIVRKHFKTILSNSTIPTTTTTQHFSSRSSHTTKSKTDNKIIPRKQVNKYPSACLTRYLEDPTQTTPGYSRSYTNSLIDTCGFPLEVSEISDLEEAMATENISRVLNIMKGVDVHLGEFQKEE